MAALWMGLQAELPDELSGVQILRHVFGGWAQVFLVVRREDARQ